ncbi:MAG: hypothetical protein SGI84_08060 [Gemmatimonadota bacterium]|nr:hypothetical protein [Gemmatimonadota bacterium]
MPDKRTVTNTRLGRREAAVIMLAAVAWYLPGIWWGLPVDAEPLYRALWGVDELGPSGALNAIRVLLGGEVYPSPQYPLAHYFVQAVFVWPYHLAMRVADNVGFAAQTDSLATLVLLHRFPSVLMAAGTATAAAAFIRRVTGSVAGSWFAAVAVATIGPLAYYARTSNVDAGALFWSMLALAVAVAALQDGLTARRAVWLGLCAAASIATKDQQYAFLVGIGAVVAVAHFRRAPASARWRAPLVGLGVSSAAYLVLSGAVLLPRWFGGHLAFIREGGASGVPEPLLELIGTYAASPATLVGYSRVAADSGALLATAVGLPMLALALLGGVHLWRTSRPLLALMVIPVLALGAGVIVPVRFVLPRFLLPVDLIVCLLASFGLAEGLRHARWRRLAQTMAAVALAWTTLRSGDLAWQMHRDSRQPAAAWLEAQLQVGDTLGYYGARRKLPTLRRDIVVIPAPDQYLPDEVYGPEGPISPAPAFLIVIPQRESELVHEWNLPAEVFDQLVAGTRGYQQVYAHQTRALFSRPMGLAPAVNPPVRIFARDDVAARLPGPRILTLPDPVRSAAAPLP